MRVIGRFLKRVMSIVIVAMIVLGCFSTQAPITATATSKYVTRSQVIKMILDELGQTYDKTSATAYIVTAQEVGLITSKTFTNFEAYANKSEVAMLLVRADEHLYGKTVEEELVDRIIDCRISDIAKIRKVYQPFLAKAFALGYIKGSSNGSYSTNRKFNPKYKVTVTYAKQLVHMISDKSARHQISPDGQLIRTTNLPKMADFYPYILASYPNSYYDWKFLFMRTKIGDDLVYGTDRWVNKVNYVSPKDYFEYNEGKKVFYYYYSKDPVNAKELYDECIDEWEENARNYLECVFNVDYRTIKDDTAWMEKLLSADLSGTIERDNTKKRINEYINAAIENETIVESKIIAVDRSTLYLSNGFMYLRAYVRYRVISSNELSTVKNSPIIFTRFTYPEFDNLKVGEWRDCYVNLDVSSCVPNYGIQKMCLNDYFYDNKVVTE